MLLRSIQLKNFRQYKGTQNMTFSSDNNQNVTVILGDNTTGKTTLVQAFNWALYGTSSFTTKDFMLNMDLAREMDKGDEETVEVEICLNHDNTEYIITRTQVYSCDSKGNVKPHEPVPKVSYKQKDGQTETIRKAVIDSTINKILPSDLSNYFFFDGERIGNISSKQDVAESVKGLLGLAALDNTMRHLDPNKKNSVIGKFNNSMDTAGNKKAAEAAQRIQLEQDRHQDLIRQLENVRDEIKHYEQRKEQLEDILRDNQPTADLQRNKEQIESSMKAEEKAMEAAYSRLMSDFNANTSAFFAKPLMARALVFLQSAKIDDKGVPNMNSTSIDFIINRGTCICGATVCEGNEVHQNLLKERHFLPPQSIGTMIRTFIDHISTYNSTNENYYTNIKMSYEDIYRYKTRIQEWSEEIEEISQKIKGKGDVKKYEEELVDVKKRLKEFSAKKDKFIADEGACKSELERLQKFYSGSITASEKNKQILLYSKYAEAIYYWVKQTYEAKEVEIKDQLETKVNEIFSKMYHGKRQVEIDSKYRVSLLTAYSDSSVKTDESRGLETVKNFAFIAGLVDLARSKIHSNIGDEDLALSSEPYPLVMDAPFSNADDKHVSAISKILPEIAEQVIMVVMAKDWAYAENVMGGRVGKKYVLEKKSETLTYIREVS